MGDGSAQFAAQLNPQLLKLGPDYGLKVIGSVGYSRGEDAFMAPPNVKAAPQSLSLIHICWLRLRLPLNLRSAMRFWDSSPWARKRLRLGKMCGWSAKDSWISHTLPALSRRIPAH